LPIVIQEFGNVFGVQMEKSMGILA
jgi:hypothetical protein